ncbi:uncharacterized protein V2V93DRAFT_363250 [Kockiozyma suomiensis]|uniref:uncharacterized protein n=1 Tax=Kockiozyma suomiensis TaxID=1337062 RepID=UPI0033440594
MSTLPAYIEDAIPLEVTDPTTILLRRLESWRHVSSMLEDYVEAHRLMYHNQARDYEKVAKAVLEAPHFDAVEKTDVALTAADGSVLESTTSPSREGISGGFFTLREKSEALIHAANEAEHNIKSSVIPHVERVSHDIKEHIKGLKGNGLKGVKEVERARGLTQKQIELLGQQSSSFGVFSGKPEPLKDPYVIHRSILMHLDSQISKENAQTDSLLTIQNDFKTFEAHVVSGIRQIFTLMDQVQTTFWDFQREAYGAVTQSFLSIPDDLEWRQFTVANKDVLADESVPKRSIDRIRYANMDHESTIPLIEGVLQRKGTMTLSKSYNTAYYVITPSKYMHQFASKDYIQSTEPEWSLYLPDTNVGAPYAQETGKNKFKLTGRDALGTLTRKHTFEFKTSTYDDLQKWWQVIHDVATSGSTPISPRATLNSNFSSLSPRGTMTSTTSSIAPTAAAAAVAAVGTESVVAPSEPAGSAIPVAGTPLATADAESPISVVSDAANPPTAVAEAIHTEAAAAAPPATIVAEPVATPMYEYVDARTDIGDSITPDDSVSQVWQQR